MKNQKFPLIKKLALPALAIILVCSLSVSSASAQTVMLKSETTNSSFLLQTSMTDPHELEAFLDGVMAAQLQAYHIPGATVSVVKDGELFFAKGYGYADLDRQSPVIADQTLFRPGSVSKLFTWTAVMQLVEQDKLDLNADVNTYLDFQIPQTYPQPITLAHLLTHTPGFENRNEGLFVRQAADIIPLREYLIKYMPARIYPPGQVTAYSNYGAALAGYIVERVSGMSYEQYVEENIFRPLEMNHSTFQRPLPSELAENLAVGYSYATGAYQAQAEWVQPAPAGGLSTTATDIARFMIAHLQDGQYGGVRILQESTVQAMHRQQFTNDPRVSGWTYGFMEAQLNGQRIIWHGGATYFFHSALMLLPDPNVGVFVSFNAIGGSVARQAFITAFLDHYYPMHRSPVSQPPPDFDQRVGQYIGTYLETRHNQTGVEKLLALQSAVSVDATANGTVQITGIGFAWPESEISQWIEVEPLVFHKVEGDGVLIFLQDEQGNITGIMDKNDPQVVYVKQSWHETASFHLPVLLSCLLIFLSAVLGWPIGFVVNRLKRLGRKPRSFLCHLARWLAWGCCALSVYFVVAFVSMMTDPEIVFRVPSALERVLVIPLIVAVLVIGLIIFTVLAWIRRYWGLWGRVYYTVLTLATLVFVWWLNYWNLLFYMLHAR